MFVKAKYIRKAGVVLAVLLVGGFLGAAHFLQGEVMRNYAAGAATRANRAEANLDSLGISILSGNVSVSGVQLTDPKNPQQNQLAIAKMEADADVYELLLGRLVIEKAELTQVSFNQLRQTPGKVLEQVLEEKPFDPNTYQVGSEDLAKLEKYVKDAKKLKEQLEKLRNWLPEGKPADANQPAGTVEKVPEKYLEHLTARLTTAPTPKMLAKLLLADKTAIPSVLFGNSKIEMTNLNDAPQAAGLPITFEITSYDTAAKLKAQADYSKGPVPEVSGTFEGFDLSKLQDLSQEAGLAFQSGQAAGTFRGTLTKENVDLTIDLSLKGLQAQGTGNGVLGLGAEQTSQVFQVLKELSTTIRVVGPPTEPRLVFDTKGLTKEFQQALVKAGKDRALQEVDKQIQKQLDGKLGDKLPAELKDSLKQPSTKGLMDSVGGLLGGKKKQQEPQETPK